MELITKSKFAGLCGVSKVAVGLACKEGKIDVVGEGRTQKVDLTGDRSIQYMNLQRDKKAPPPTPVHNSAPQPTVTYADAGEAEKKDTELTEKVVEAIGDGKQITIDVAALSKTSVDKLRQIENIRKVQVETAKKRGELIDRNVLRSFMAEMYSIDVNEFQTLGPNLAPEVAAMLGVDDADSIIKVGQLIEAEVFKVLEHVKRRTREFLVEMKEEALGELE